MKESLTKNVDEVQMNGENFRNILRPKSEEKCDRSNWGRCPAKGQTCKKWNRLNHFAICGRIKINNAQKIKQSMEEYLLDSLTEENKTLDPVFGNLKNCGSHLKFKIDAGVNISIISHKTNKNLRNRPLSRYIIVRRKILDSHDA